MTATREAIRPDSPAHQGRTRYRCLTRKVVTAWAPFYVAVDFDHQAEPVRVHVSQPGKHMGTEFGAAIDAMGEAVTEALEHGRGRAAPITASFGVTIVNDRPVDEQDPPVELRLIWAGRKHDLQIQDMLRAIEGAITGLIAEAGPA